MWGGMIAKPELTIMATRDSGSFAKPISAQFIGDKTGQAVFETAVAEKSAYDLGGVRAAVGLGLLMSKTSSLTARYEHSKNDGSDSNTFELMARWDL